MACCKSTNLYTITTGYKSGNITLETRFGQLHPDVPSNIKENYHLSKSSHNSSQHAAKMILFYDNSDGVIKTYFAQILKHSKNDQYIVANRIWVIGTPKEPLATHLTSERSNATQLYKSVFGEVTKRLKNDSHLWRLNDMPLVSFEPVETVQLPSEVNYELVYSALSRKKYEHFGEDMKRFCKVIIDDFTHSETMKMMNGDLTKTAIGYPTKQAIDKANQVLYHLDRFINRQDAKITSPRMASILFHLYIPSHCDKSNPLPMIDSFKSLHEKQQLLQALQFETYRQQVTLPYRSRVNLLLGRLNYPLIVLDRGSGFVLAVEECIRNTGVSPTQSNELSLVNMYSFDTSIRKPEDCYDGAKLLLWHGVPATKTYELLRSGFDSSLRDGGVTFGCGLGLYFADTVGLFVPKFDPRATNREFVLSLNEVHLGTPKFLTSPHCSRLNIPPGFDSLLKMGCYRYKGDDFAVDDYDNHLYNGPLKASKGTSCHTSLHNRYAVNSSKQVKIRYLVHMKMNV